MIISRIADIIHILAARLPVAWFAFAGSFLEEVIAPIPTYVILTPSGSFALSQGRGFAFLIWLAIAGSLGKTIASILYFVLADVLEDVIVPKWGKYIGITHEEIEAIGKRFEHSTGGFLFLLALRSAPFMPSPTVSIVSGLVKVPWKIYVSATFLGSIIRGFCYIAVGYYGWTAMRYVLDNFEKVSGVLEIVAPIAVIAAIAFLAIRAHKKGYWRKK